MGTVALYNILPAISPERERYSDYSTSIKALLAAEEGVQQEDEEYLVLGNLNAEYALPYGALLDYRNLAFLDKAGLTLSEYVVSRGISHILYSEEIDLIYHRRPVWNLLYGNVVPWYNQMQELLKQRGELIGCFASPVYGMRIVPYMGKQNWEVRLYRIVPNSGTGSGNK